MAQPRSGRHRGPVVRHGLFQVRALGVSLQHADKGSTTRAYNGAVDRDAYE